MENENENSKTVSSKIIVLYLVGILVVIFLSLPLIFQEETNPVNKQNKEQEVLPLQSENPFTYYFKLFKNFYSSSKRQERNTFSKIKNNLEAKNNVAGTALRRGAQQYMASKSSGNISEEQTAMASKNYYAEENAPQQYYQNEKQQQIQNSLQELTEPFAKQEPFEDFLMEGLYDTSELDSYERKSEARKKALDIINPSPFAFLPSAEMTEKPLAKNTSQIITQKNTPQEAKTILFSDGTKTNRVSASASKYINKVFNPFKTTETIADKINLAGLPFETQAGLVSAKLNDIYTDNQASSSSSGSSYPYGPDNQGGQSGPTPRPPLPPNPPAPPQDTFDPTKWDPKVDVLCSVPSFTAVQEAPALLKPLGQPQETQTQEKTQEESNPDKIEHCDQELQDKLPKVNNEMQQNYNYLLVSGRYQGKIMIPAYNSLSDTILTFGIQSVDQNFLNYPQQLQGKKFSENTKPTNFEFAVDLNPQVFEQMLRDDKTILISVDPQDQQRHPEKTILIQSGEIETFSGVNRIIDEINNFPQKQAELKRAAKENEKKEKEQKAQDLQNKINSAI